MWVSVEGSQVTGVIMINGSFIDDGTASIDTLRFQKYDTSADYEPLIFKHEFSATSSELKVYGSKNGISTTYEQSYEQRSNTGDFAIKFSTLTSGRITILYSDDSATESRMNFDYNDNWSSWGPLSSTPFMNTDRIFSQLQRTKYRYIRVCAVESPTFCNEEEEPPKYDLQERIVLNCTAVGPQPLTAQWSASATNSAITQVLASATTQVDSDTGTVITSTVTIPSLLIDHLTTYTCKVASDSIDRYQDFSVTYSRDITVSLGTSSDSYYMANTTNLTFSWEITGWPLADVTLLTQLDSEDNEEESNGTEERRRRRRRRSSEENYQLTRTENYDEVPPKLTLTVKFNVVLPGDSFAFIFIDNEGGKNETLTITTITRVGAACVAGEYGVGAECVECGAGFTSPAGSDSQDQCVEATSNCEEGYYGIDDDCTACPDGTTSTAGALNQNACFTYPNAHKNTGSDNENLAVIIGGAIAGAVLLLLLIAIIFLFIYKKRYVAAAPRTDTQRQPRVTLKLESPNEQGPSQSSYRGTGSVVRNPTAVTKEPSPEPDEDLYDNGRLRKNPSNDPKNRTIRKIGDHERDIDASIRALDDINLNDPEPQYAELDKEHFNTLKREKEERKRREQEEGRSA